jgi:hypothetical protein
MALIRLETESGLQVIDAGDIDFLFEELESENFGPFKRNGWMNIDVRGANLRMPMSADCFAEIVAAMQKAGRHVHTFRRDLDALVAFAWESVTGVVRSTDGTVGLRFYSGDFSWSPWPLDETVRRWRAVKAGEPTR